MTNQLHFKYQNFVALVDLKKIRFAYVEYYSESIGDTLQIINQFVKYTHLLCQMEEEKHGGKKKHSSLCCLKKQFRTTTLSTLMLHCTSVRFLKYIILS